MHNRPDRGGTGRPVGGRPATGAGPGLVRIAHTKHAARDVSVPVRFRRRNSGTVFAGSLGLEVLVLTAMEVL
ncbi:hypothetical protein [Frankia sp. EAN1pec]|uniref:hypothetical protein n=1 Tax=Parafrankia sp. (strain EAN1pec) TaxID=298653 RepID=UPI00059B7816